jgi:alpha-L-arabinofuranosidase
MPVGEGKAGSIETNRWYDLKVEVRGDRIRSYLDGQLINEGQARPEPKLFAQAGRDDATGEIVVKAINVSGQPVAADLQVDGDGAAAILPSAAITELKSANRFDNNSLEQPVKITPVENPMHAGARFAHEFPPYSLSVIRLKTHK